MCSHKYVINPIKKGGYNKSKNWYIICTKCSVFDMLSQPTTSGHKEIYMKMVHEIVTWNCYMKLLYEIVIWNYHIWNSCVNA